MIWHRWIPDNEDEDGNVIGEHVEIFFASMNPTESDSRKVLEIVLNGQTEVYNVVLLEDGDVDVKLTKASVRLINTTLMLLFVSLGFDRVILFCQLPVQRPHHPNFSLFIKSLRFGRYL